MAESIEENIRITADSSGAVTGLDNVSNSISTFDGKVKSLGGSFANSARTAGAAADNAFGKKLSSVGLTTLNYEMLRSLEYTGKASPIIGALNMAWHQLATTIGLSSSALFPYIAGLAAVVAVVAKMKSSNTDLETSLKNTLAAQIESGKEAKSDVEAFDKLHTVINTKLTPAMDGYEKSIRRVNAAKHSEEIATVLKQIEQNKEKITELTAASTRYKEKIIEQQDAQITQIKGLESAGVQTRKFASDTRSLDGYIEKNNKSVVALNDTLAKNVLLAEALSKGYTSVAEYLNVTTEKYKELGEASKASAEKQEKSLKDLNALADKVFREEVNRQKKLEDAQEKRISSRFALENAIAGRIITVHEAMNKTLNDFAKDTYLNMSKGFGDTIAGMMLDGEDFSKSMDKVFQNVLRSFISMMAQMMIRVAAMKTLQFLGVPIPAFGAAQGFVGTVSKPTLFMVGEGGEDEHVQITPKSQMGSRSFMPAGGGVSNTRSSTMSISIVQHIANGDKVNVSRMADQLGRQIISRIRGQGDRGFVPG